MITKEVLNQNQATWINIQIETISELEEAAEAYELDDEILTYSLDKNERAHIEYNEQSQTFALIFNVANQTKTDNHYETTPMTFLVQKNRLITISNTNNVYIIDLMKREMNRKPGFSLYQFLFASLFLVSDAYFPAVEEMNSERKLIDHRLKEQVTKKNLLSLSDLDIGIVYFVAASRQNVVLLEQIRSHAVYRTLTKEEKEELDDALIEAKQLVEMTQLTSQIVQQLTGAYNNVLNNNLNDTMRILTILSVLLTIPTIITGFFGMNVPLPLEHNVFGWLIALGISVVLWFGLSLILRKIMK